MDYRLLSNNDNHDTRHHSIARMCRDTSHETTISQFSKLLQTIRKRDSEEFPDDVKQEKLRFYFTDKSWLELVVEKNLRTDDLREILLARRKLEKSDWSIFETWPELGIERVLEDCEDVLEVHRNMELFATRYSKKFVFCKHVQNRDESQCHLFSEDQSLPRMFNIAWIKNPIVDRWEKTCLVLQDSTLYTTKGDNERPAPYAQLTDCHIYVTRSAARRYGAPHEFGICTLPSGKVGGEDIVYIDVSLKIIVFDSRETRDRWHAIMRLAKYGKQLRENYKAFRNKQCDQTNINHGDGQNQNQNQNQKSNANNTSTESIRSRVAMDFTGSVGRIVEDPLEAKEIAEREGAAWRIHWKPFSRPTKDGKAMPLHGLDAGVHVLQPWYHGDLRRDIAANVIREQGTVDGAFLVRGSRSKKGTFVITYIYRNKVIHTPIEQVYDERRGKWLFSLDKGVTKFYDVQQLIQFYQLNAGHLPTKLTHVVQSQQGIPGVAELSVATRGSSASSPDMSPEAQPRRGCGKKKEGASF